MAFLLVLLVEKSGNGTVVSTSPAVPSRDASTLPQVLTPGFATRLAAKDEMSEVHDGLAEETDTAASGGQGDIGKS